MSSAVLQTPNTLDDAQQRSEGVWHAAWRRFKADRVGLVSLVIVVGFLLLIALVGHSAWWPRTGRPRSAWPTRRPPSWARAPAEATGSIAGAQGPERRPVRHRPAGAALQGMGRSRRAAEDHRDTRRRETLPLGGDRLGRDVLAKAVKGTEISVFVGVLAAVVATGIGTLLGAFGGFFGGKIGDLLEWLYNVFESIPGILLIFAFAAVFGRGTLTVVMILGLTGWTGMYRQVRAEFIKHASREYVRSAEAIGASRISRMFRHILPNVSHVVLVRMGLLVVGFIKAEVILSYLGLGVSVDQVSWGTMLAEAQSELILGQWWQLAAATLFMAVFVTAFSLMADAARDALDPKLRGLE